MALKSPLKLSRIVMLTNDLSTIGGIPGRTRKTLRHAVGREVEYVGISLENNLGSAEPNNIVWQEKPQDILAKLKSWSPTDTAIIYPNNLLQLLPQPLRAAVDRFPLIFIGSGQLTYLIQNTPVLADRKSTASAKVTKLVVFSRMDQSVYDQFGIYNHERAFHPVEIRTANSYAPDKNRHVAYVGRLCFDIKGADRLIDAAIALKKLQLGPLRVFTVSNERLSPKLHEFRQLIADNQLSDDVEIILDERDPEKIYETTSLLLVPSRKESFPNVILEAYARGIPVVGMSHAPGPAELIVDGETGFLVDRFSVDGLTSIFSSLSDDLRMRLSQNAFERHKLYGMDDYFARIESIATDAVNEFTGVNTQPVYPDLRPLRELQRRIDALETMLGPLKHVLDSAIRLRRSYLSGRKKRTERPRVRS